MTKDQNQQDKQSSNFRQQILHDLNQSHQDTHLPLTGEKEGSFDASSVLEPEDLGATIEQPVLSEDLVSEETNIFEDYRTLEETILAEEALLKDVASQPASPAPEELEETLVAPSTEKMKKKEKSESLSRRSIKRHRKQQEKAANRIAATVVLVVLLALGIGLFTGYSYLKASLSPIDTKATDVVQVEIPTGSSTLEIGQILVKNKLIKNATIFNYYAKLKSYNNFQSGFYNLSQTMSVDDLALALQETGSATPQAPIAGKIAVIEGYTLEQIAKAVTKNVHAKNGKGKTSFTEEEFLKTVKNPDFINRMVVAYPRLLGNLPAADSGVKYQLEGYLFPATYDYTKETTMEQLVEQMLAATDARLQPYYDQLAAKGLDVNQLLTLASLVEKEGATDEDRRNIASVFYNRLNIEMPLQSNIAILYAMGKLGEKTTLAEDAAIDTQIASPYNIYVNPGLMPGPVDSPGMSAIQATFSPNETDYLYFVADVTTGTVYYSVTMEEHQKNVDTYVNSKLSE